MCICARWETLHGPLQQQDAAEFYSFLINELNGPMMSFVRRTFTGARADESDLGTEEKQCIVPVHISDDKPDLEQGLGQWFHDNLAIVSREVDGELDGEILPLFEADVEALITYTISNVPRVLAIMLKRFDASLRKRNDSCTFPSTIHAFKYSRQASEGELKEVPWNLRSVVCHRGETVTSGHYYATTLSDVPGMWLLFDDLKTPSVSEGDLANVPHDGFLFLYELDTDAHMAALAKMQAPGHVHHC